LADRESPSCHALSLAAINDKAKQWHPDVPVIDQNAEY
jgi:hypothetical protein